MARNFLSQEETEETFEHEGIGVKLTFETKCFHKWTRVYNTYKYKTPNPIKPIVEHQHFFCMGLWHQKMQ
jgi:hypothetical protein